MGIGVRSSGVCGEGWSAEVDSTPPFKSDAWSQVNAASASESSE